MTVSEKQMEAAREIYLLLGLRHEHQKDYAAAIMCIAAALAAAEREGMMRAAGIASQCGVDAVEFAKKHIGERHIDFLRFQDGCEASAAAIRNQANTHSPDPSHQVNSPASTSSPEPGTPISSQVFSMSSPADKAGSDGSLYPATHHASRNGEG